MRKFKFRAWRHDGEYSHMIESEIGVYTAIKHCLGIATSAGFSDIDNQPKKDGYTLMQWTGLKDRNGKEIYEGDILQDYGKNGKPITRVKVIWNDGFWDGEPLEGERYKTCYAGFKRCEIIGNVFKNPELLEVGECKD